MKNLFDYHSHEKNEDIKEFWESGIFIFDSNVLLNLYRYHKETSDKLLEVLENLKGRIWIPYQVGMEFHKNRLTTIADQTGKFSNVKSTIGEIRNTARSSIEKLKIRNRHSLINIENFSEKIEKLLSDFDEDLEQLKKKQQGVTDQDPILERVHELFEGRVGSAPNQKEIDAIYLEGEKRYKYKRPPGYKDLEKGEKDADTYFHSGILYKGRYGDLVAWKQIINHAKTSGIDIIIFITDDGKEDWWLQVDSLGKKTVGPRLELVHEIKQEAGVKKFLMYQPEQFLTYANNYLNAKISPNEIDEVREVTLEQKFPKRDIEILNDIKWQKLQGILSEISKIYTAHVNTETGVVSHKRINSEELVAVRAITFDKSQNLNAIILNTLSSIHNDALTAGITLGHAFISFDTTNEASQAGILLNNMHHLALAPIAIKITLGATITSDKENSFIATSERIFL
jgi:hypothetical protein